MDFPLFIRHRLRELGTEQRDLAAAAQVTDSYISQLLTGKKAPPAPERSGTPSRRDTAPHRERAGRAGARAGAGGEPDPHTHPRAGRAGRSAQEQRFTRADWANRSTARPAGNTLAVARVAAGDVRSPGDCSDDRFGGTGTGGGWKRIEGGRGSGGAGAGTHPGGRAPTRDLPRGPGARARTYRCSATLTDATSLRRTTCFIGQRSVVPS